MSFMDRITGRQPDDSSSSSNSTPLRGSASVVTPFRSAASNAHRPITGSAERLNLRKASDRSSLIDRPWGSWQAEAWQYFDTITEIKYAYSLLAANMSRIRLYPAVSLDPDAAPSSVTTVQRRLKEQKNKDVQESEEDMLDPPDGVNDAVMEYMVELLSGLQAGPGGAPGLLRSFSLNICVAGECYLTKIDDRWSIRSTEEVMIRQADEKPVLRTTRSMSSRVTGSPRDRELPIDTYIGRIWREHPRYSGEPESAMLGLREACEELLTLERMIRATARSRMNAGMLFVPDGISAAAASVADDAQDAEEEPDPFEQELMQALITPVSDEASAATVVPMLARGPADLGDGIKYLTFSRESDKSLVDRSDKTIERILHGLEVPKDMVTGLAHVKYCVDDQTEALTRDGWKRHDELRVGDEVLTLNPETRLSEWQPVQAVNTFDVVDETMRRVEQRGHSSLTTMNHRWPMLLPSGEVEWTTSERFMAKHSIMNSAASAETPTEAKYTDDFVELVAWLQTEGGFDNRSSGRRNRRWSAISQSYSANPVHHDRIRDLLTRLYGPPVVARGYSEAAAARDHEPRWLVKVDSAGNPYYFHLNEEITRTFEHVFVKDTNKVLDRSFIYSLTRAQLELFVQVCSRGDGCGEDIIGSVYGQNDEDRLENFELACHLLGYPVNRRSNGHVYDEKSGKRWWDVRVKHARTVWPYRHHDTTEKYTGVVWCPTTENHTWFARRNGTFYFTGNSNAQAIDDDMYRSHIEPLALLLCDSLSEIYLRPALKSKFPGLSDATLAKLTIWYDPTEVTSKPDAAAAAGSLYDNLEISGDALRRANGFSDADAPGEDELANRLAIKSAATMPPELLTALIKNLLPDVFAQQQAAGAAASGMPESARRMLYPDQAGGSQNGSQSPDTSEGGASAAPGSTEFDTSVSDQGAT